MNNSIHIATIAGIPIRVHYTLLVALPFIAAVFFGPFNFVVAVLTAIIFFACVALHELSHSFMGLHCGYRIREIVLMPIGGVAKIERMTDRPRDELLVAAAGPAASILLGALFITPAIGLHLIGAEGFSQYMLVLGALNIVLAVFNLLPAFPMDGGRIFRAALTPRLGKLKATRIAVRTGQALAVLLFVLSLFRDRLVPMLIQMVIAYVVFQAAEREYRMVMMQEIMHRQAWRPFGDFGMPESNDTGAGIDVGPPPYAQSASEDSGDFLRRWRDAIRSWFS